MPFTLTSQPTTHLRIVCGNDELRSPMVPRGDGGIGGGGQGMRGGGAGRRRRWTWVEVCGPCWPLSAVPPLLLFCSYPISIDSTRVHDNVAFSTFSSPITTPTARQQHECHRLCHWRPTTWVLHCPRVVARRRHDYVDARFVTDGGRRGDHGETAQDDQVVSGALYELGAASKLPSSPVLGSLPLTPTKREPDEGTYFLRRPVDCLRGILDGSVTAMPDHPWRQWSGQQRWAYFVVSASSCPRIIPHRGHGCMGRRVASTGLHHSLLRPSTRRHLPLERRA